MQQPPSAQPAAPQHDPVFDQPQFGQPQYDAPQYDAPQYDVPPHTLAYERPPVEDYERGYGRDYDYAPERDYGRDYDSGYRSDDRDYDRGRSSDRDRPFYEQPLPDLDDEPRRRRSRRPEPDDYDDEEERSRSRRRRKESAEDYELTREHRAERARIAGSFVYFLTGLICTSFLLHIVFNLFSANPKSGVVSFVHTVAQTFVFGFGDVFKPGDNTLGLVVNFGLAAIVYFILGRLLARTLKQR